MEQKINTQLDIVEKSIKWVKETDSMQGAKGDNAHRYLVNFRRKLNKKKFALEGNPAAAMYGESQVGKSYLISSLLSEKGKPFSIMDENNVVHNFIEEINPPGGGNESTSLVSRFSVNYKPDHPRFPVKAVLLSPADIVLVLCDSFYNDIKADHHLILETEQINRDLKVFKETFGSRQPQQNIFGEDDIWDMQDYFNEHFSSKASNILFSQFFNEVSLLISKVKSNEWKDLFSLLWNRNEKFTTLYSSIISEYEKLSFTHTVYLPLESVLYKHGTLLDVKRLKEIYAAPDMIESQYKANTTVFCQGNEIVFAKSYLCALCTELVFCQQETLLESKPFLKETDLLDFPGARGRLTLPVNLIEDENIPELLIRGKVAYLFNKYSDAEKISIFVLCAKHEQAAQRSMPEMLNNWINKFIGDSPEKRELFIQHSKIPPLFIIGTFFNVNLEYNPLQDREDNLSSLNYRWNQRFERTLAVELLNTETYPWFTHWTSSDKDFKNIFLLRDFVYSESKSQIFRGFIEHATELEEINPPNYSNFRKKLRQSFIEYDFVKRHFENPAESWDRAASMNEDGTKLIIDKLTIAANHINLARREKTLRELNTIAEGILKLLNEYYNSPDKAENLLKAKSIAGTIQAKLDIAFGQNPYFFGTMMKELMLNNSDVYHLYLEKIRDIERRDVVNMDKYGAIRMRVPELNPNDSFEINLERLTWTYERQTPVECQQYFEQEERIDLNELFYGNCERVKNFSQVLAEALEAFWFEQHMPTNHKKLAAIFSEMGLTHILEMLRTLFKKLHLSKMIAEKIRRYVDGYRNIEDVYEMIADISTEIINKFINTIGLEYFDQSDFADLKQANEKNALGLVLEHDELEFEQNSRAEVAALITKMGNLSELLNQNPLPQDAKRLPNYRSYIVWSDLLKVGFVSVCEIPNYDVHANEKLGTIINLCKTIQ